MGLDMYLTKKIYVGANYDHNMVTGTIDLKRRGEPIKIDLSKLNSIDEEAGYWRKANQIHSWFVREIQKGKDDCDVYHVPYKKLIELRDVCLQVLETKDVSLLPPQSGFFFGSTDIDDYYFEDLKDTIKIIETLDPNGSYYYQSSW